MKPSKPEQIGSLIDRLMKEYKLDKPAFSHKACRLWEQIVGEGVNRFTTRRKVDGSILHVWISSAPLKNELMFRRQDLLMAINYELGKDFLTEIRIH